MKTILCFGDSNTYGYIPGTGDRYSEDLRWTGILANNLRDSGYRVIEEGLVGRTSIFPDQLRPGRRGIDYLPVALESHFPLDKVILMLGTNDCKTVYNASAEVIGKGVEKLINQIRDLDETIDILLLSPIHLGERVWEEEFDPEFNQISVETSQKLKGVYQKIAEKYGCSFLAASDVAQPSEVDQEHLTKEGHAALAKAITEKLAG